MAAGEQGCRSTIVEPTQSVFGITNAKVPMLWRARALVSRSEMTGPNCPSESPNRYFGLLVGALLISADTAWRAASWFGLCRNVASNASRASLVRPLRASIMPKL